MNGPPLMASYEVELMETCRLRFGPKHKHHELMASYEVELMETVCLIQGWILNTPAYGFL